MNYFFDRVLKPYILENHYTNICEIGAGEGSNTDELLSIASLRLSVIDPCIDLDLVDKYKTADRIKIFKGLSLEVLSRIPERFDCVLIDGDHNWYTVFNELKTIEEKDLLERGGTVFLHDVCWPHGRRDIYYIPESIPEKFRHPYAKKSIKYGKSELSDMLEVDYDPNVAAYEGGERNGVLTAIEDFLKIYGNKYLFFILHIQYGLGVLIKKRGIATRIKYIKWVFIKIYYENIPKIIEFIEFKSPFIYSLYARMAKKIGFRRW